MVIVDSAVVLGLVGFVFYAMIRLLYRSQDRRTASRPGRWVPSHYDVKGVTHVVLQKVSPTGYGVLDEHVVAKVHIEDPEYDAKFLTAMAIARERRALFESEEE